MGPWIHATLVTGICIHLPLMSKYYLLILLEYLPTNNLQESCNIG